VCQYGIRVEYLRKGADVSHREVSKALAADRCGEQTRSIIRQVKSASIIPA